MSQTPLVLIFGESENDTGALKRLLRAFVSSTTVFDARPVRNPIILNRNAASRKRKKMASLIKIIEHRERKAGRFVIVIAHRDCDSCEPSHEGLGKQLVSDLKSEGVAHPVAATPAWDIEAWWLLFPEALHRTRPCWRKIKQSSQSVGSLENTKKLLIDSLRPRDNVSCKEYSESDSLEIAEQISLHRLVSAPILSRSASLRQFSEDFVAALTS